MEFLFGALVVILIGFFWNRSRRNAELEASTLRNIAELEAAGLASCSKLEDLIEASDDPQTICRAILAMRRSELPEEISNLWQHIDDVSRRVNQYAEHCEAITKRPIPNFNDRWTEATANLMATIHRYAGSK
jgi:hypothetical protein